MPDDQLRPEVVAALTEPAPLPADLVDQVLDATDPERQAAADQLLDQTRQFLEQAGVLRPSIGALDLRQRTVVALSAVYGTVEGVWRQPAYTDRPLGDVLKVVDADRAAWAIALLRWGGLLPPE
jgi:hypothetical protein